MAIAYFGGGKWGGTANSASVTYTLPASIPVGAIIITFRVTGTTNTGNGPYTALQHWADSNVDACITWKVADGTEATFTNPTELSGSERCATITMVFTGVDTTTPFIAENTSIQAGTSTTIATATVNNTDASAWRVSFFGYRTSTATDTGNYWTASSDVEKFDLAGTSNSNDPRIAAYSSDTTIATGNTSVTGTSASTSDAIAWIGILKPGTQTHSADVTSAVTATLASALAGTTKPVDSTSTVTATLAAALAGTTKPVDAALAATASPTAALAGSTKPVDVTSTVTATLAAALAGSTKPVDGTSTVTATVAATANSDKPVDATALTVTSTTAAAATVDKPVDAPVSVTATLASALAGSTKPIDASLSVTSTATGAAVSDKPVAATSSVTATIAAAATVDKPVDASLTATATIAADADVDSSGGSVDKGSADTASAVDASSIDVSTDSADTGTGVDAVTAVEFLSADVGSGSDAVTGVAFTAADTATAADAGAADASLAGSDTGGGVDDGTAEEELIQKIGSDTGTATDAATAANATLTAAEAVSLVDAGAPAVIVQKASADTGSGFDVHLTPCSDADNALFVPDGIYTTNSATKDPSWTHSWTLDEPPSGSVLVGTQLFTVTLRKSSLGGASPTLDYMDLFVHTGPSSFTRYRVIGPTVITDGMTTLSGTVSDAFGDCTDFTRNYLQISVTS